jgi:hypothetical protein
VKTLIALLLMLSATWALSIGEGDYPLPFHEGLLQEVLPGAEEQPCPVRVAPLRKTLQTEYAAYRLICLDSVMPHIHLLILMDEVFDYSWRPIDGPGDGPMLHAILKNDALSTSVLLLSHHESGLLLLAFFDADSTP